MTTDELKRELLDLAERAKDKSNADEVQAVASSLFSVLAAIESNEQFAFMQHTAQYSAGYVRRATAHRN